ncbi:MAG: ABC transporter permease [Chloroflexota bacterium]|nr:ABC transporter permease [Chloroflexota bacterium]
MPDRIAKRESRTTGLALRAALLVPPIVLLILGLTVWQVYVTAARVPDFLLPGPLAIWRSGVDQRVLLAANALPTIEIAVLGFLLSIVAGLALALAIRYSRLLHMAVYPLVVVSQTIPMIALAPILVVLLGFSLLPKLIIVALICFFPIVVNTVDGFESVDPDLVNLLRTLGAGRFQILREVEWPSALPYIFSGAKVAATFSVVGALYGEWVGSSEGLGYLMIQKMSEFDTTVIFAALVILAALGMTLFLLVAALERLCMPWQSRERKRSALPYLRQRKGTR